MKVSAMIVFGYLILTALVGIYMTKYNKSVNEFFVAKRGLTVFIIIPLLFGELIAGAGTVGNATEAFRMGFSSVWATWSMLLGCLFFVFTTLVFFRVAGSKLNLYSVPEAYQVLFDKRTRLVVMVILVVSFLIVYAIQPAAMAMILGPMFKVDITTMSVICGVLFAIITATGGLHGLGWTSIVHSIVKFICMAIVAWYAVQYVGGFDQMKAKLPETYFSFGRPDWLTVCAWAFGGAITYLTTPLLVSLVYGSKTLKDAKIGIFVGALIILPFALFPSLIGMVGKIVMPGAPARTILYAMSNQLGEVFAGLVSMTIVAAVLCAAPAALLVIVTILSRDFFRIVRPHATDKEDLLFSRICIIVIGIGGAYFGAQAGSIFMQLLGALQIRTVGGIILFAAVLWPRVDARAGFWSILFGCGTAAVWHFTGNPFGVAPMWPSFAIGLPLLIILTLMNKEPASESWKRYHAAYQEAKREGIV